MFFGTAQSQVYTVKYDTMQHFEYDSHEDPVKVLEEERSRLPKYGVGEMIVEIDLNNKILKVTGNGEFVREIKKVIYDKEGNLLLEYGHKENNYSDASILITDGKLGSSNRKVIMYWYFDGKQTKGEFGYLD